MRPGRGADRLERGVDRRIHWTRSRGRGRRVGRVGTGCFDGDVQVTGLLVVTFWAFLGAFLL